MTTITVKIPNAMEPDMSKYVKNIGGEIVKTKHAMIEDEDDEVTHEQFFGENIKRVINAFSKK